MDGLEVHADGGKVYVGQVGSGQGTSSVWFQSGPVSVVVIEVPRWVSLYNHVEIRSGWWVQL